MRSIARTFLVLTIFFLTCGPVAAALQASAHADEANRAEAERLWELAIKAKGGRERLHAVNNLQMSVREKYWWMLKRFTLIEENLSVFPGKFWEWNDQRGSIFGFSIRLHNFDQDLHWSYLDRGKGGSLTRILEGGRAAL
ncbi:MAG: hypothetical protein AABN95_22320 [Acidobacteriota bacterium]